MNPYWPSCQQWARLLWALFWLSLLQCRWSGSDERQFVGKQQVVGLIAHGGAFGAAASCWVWSGWFTGRVRIKNSSKHIVMSHLTTLISTAVRSHCSAQLAHFPEEFTPSGLFSIPLFCSALPPTTHIRLFKAFYQFLLSLANTARSSVLHLCSVLDQSILPSSSSLPFVSCPVEAEYWHKHTRRSECSLSLSGLPAHCPANSRKILDFQKAYPVSVRRKMALEFCEMAVGLWLAVLWLQRRSGSKRCGQQRRRGSALMKYLSSRIEVELKGR